MSVINNLPNDPSTYLNKIREYIINKNNELGEDVVKMNEIADKLQENIDSIVLKVKSLEDAQKQMTETLADNDANIKKMKNELENNEKNETELTNLQNKINSLEKENAELNESITKVNEEKSSNLDTVSELQNKLSQQEQQWNTTKQSFLNELKSIDSALQEYVSNTKTNIVKTSEMLERANERLITVLPFGQSRKMFMGDNDPYSVLCKSISLKNDSIDSNKFSDWSNIKPNYDKKNNNIYSNILDDDDDDNDKSKNKTVLDNNPSINDEDSEEESGSEESGSEESGSEESGSEESGSEESGSEESGTEASGTEESANKKSGTEESGTEESGTEESGFGNFNLEKLL